MTQPALLVYRGAVNVRTSAGLSAPVRFQTLAPDFALCMGKAGPDASGFMWLEGDFGDRGQGWTRVDVTYAVGDFRLLAGGQWANVILATGAFPTVPVPAPTPPAGTSNRWPSPVTPCTVTEDFGGPTGHLGVDLAAPLGTSVYSRGMGIVYSADDCPACPGGNGAVAGTSDPHTNYGFGINVVVRYAHADVPASAQAAMDKGGARWLFIRYAHLSERKVAAGQAVITNERVGLLGTSGNSSGPHCHVECRASANEGPTNVFNEALVDPGTVFVL